MDRETVNRTLMEMERLRHDAMEAETNAEAKRLMREYGRLSRAVAPFLNLSTKEPQP